MSAAISSSDAACRKCGWRNVTYCVADDCPIRPTESDGGAA